MAKTTKNNSSSHIVVVCHAWYDDLIGGSFRLASEFAEHLAASGLQVSYVCCSVTDETPEREVSRGVSVYRYPPPSRTSGQFARLRHHVRQTKNLVREIQAEGPINAISNHSPLQGLGAARAVKGKGTFINYTVHSPFDDELLSNSDGSPPSFKQRIAARVARWVDQRNVSLAGSVQTLSRYTQETFLRQHGRAMTSKGIVAPGWVDTDRFLPVDDRAALRQSLGNDWLTDVPLLFTLRRLESRMGLDTLVEACHVLNQEERPFRVLIGGGGSLKENLQAMINERGLSQKVRLLGRLPEEQLANCYAAADCFVLPTRALECFGLIVLEAFACNTPVIASSAAAIPELAEQQGTDWMFEPGNVGQLAERMRSFLEKQLSPTEDLRAIAEKYDKPKILSRWTELLQPSPYLPSAASPS